MTDRGIFKRHKKNRKKRKSRFTLFLLLSVFVLCIIIVSLLLSGLALYILVKCAVFPITTLLHRPSFFFLIIFLTSLIIGFFITAVVSRVSLKPINRMIDRMNSLAAGDFNARLDFGRPISSHSAFKEISDSFNKMATELQSTELLRSDFINNFSHEFKTPIVSIAGFAKLIRRGNLTEEQKAEYLKIIEEESLRLSYMATNVLNLTKVENQTILSNVTRFNLSEQIRSCILLLEPKWSQKNLEMLVDFSEYEIEANEELLKLVWINILDNAVKFSPHYGTVGVEICEKNENVEVKIINSGSEIAKEKLEKIFCKFYQADESHASRGNGVGLAVVKSTVLLHAGNVFAESERGVTTFTVVLPKTQKT